MTPRISVVIPASNEEALIRRTLDRLLHGATTGELEVIVVANGCRDATAAVARSVPGVEVIEIPEASKIAALNAGDSSARFFPRAYVDADATVSVEAMRALADALRAPHIPLVAAPKFRVDASRASLLVRQYYRVWERTHFRTNHHVGSGLYALSRAGRQRFGAFPEVIADDRFVQQLFEPAERVIVESAEFWVESPRTMRALIRRGVRIAIGNAQLPEELKERPSAAGRARAGWVLRGVVPNPGLWIPFLVYSGVYGVVAAQAYVVRRRRGAVAWNRDDTTRAERADGIRNADS